MKNLTERLQKNDPEFQLVSIPLELQSELKKLGVKFHKKGFNEVLFVRNIANKEPIEDVLNYYQKRDIIRRFFVNHMNLSITQIEDFKMIAQDYKNNQAIEYLDSILEYAKEREIESKRILENLKNIEIGRQKYKLERKKQEEKINTLTVQKVVSVDDESIHHLEENYENDNSVTKKVAEQIEV